MNPVSRYTIEGANENDSESSRDAHCAVKETGVSPLYQRIPVYFTHSDPRGAITGLLNFGSWKEMNFITSIADTVRGRHYHKETEECFFILSGRIKVTFRKPIDCDDSCSAEHECACNCELAYRTATPYRDSVPRHNLCILRRHISRRENIGEEQYFLIGKIALDL